MRDHDIIFECPFFWLILLDMLFCREKDWVRENFPKNNMHDTIWSSSLSRKSAVVMHSKINFCTDSAGKHYWLYMGSHNFSQVCYNRMLCWLSGNNTMCRLEWGIYNPEKRCARGGFCVSKCSAVRFDDLWGPFLYKPQNFAAHTLKRARTQHSGVAPL